MEEQPLRLLQQLSGASLSDGSFVLSLHPDGSRLAVARGPALFVYPLLPATSLEAADAGEPGTTDGTGHPDEQQQLQQALRERQATHGSAGPRSAAAAPGTPLRFACKGDSGPGAICQDDITAMAWLAFARPPSAPQGGSLERGRSGGGGGGGGVDGDHHGMQGRAVRDHRRTTSSGGSGGVFASIQVMMEDHELQRQEQAVHRQPHSGYSLVVLLSGTRGGALQLHDADSGAVLLRQQLHPGPVVSIAVRTWRMGLNPSEAIEDVTVGWADAVARLAAWELRAAATTCYAAAAAAAEAKARGGGGGGQARFGLWGSSSLSSAPPGPDIKPLAVQKWEVPPGAARGRSCVVCCGQRPRDLYSLLQAAGPSSSTATGKTIFLAGGNKSAYLAALEVDEQSSGGGGALSYISSVATSVWGLARTARNVATAPLALGGGLKYLMNPFQLAGGGGASAAGGGGSGVSPGAAPLASFPDAIAGQRLPSTGVWRQHRDDGRAVLALAPAPHGSLVAAVDSLGRVLLVEVGAMLVSRMWKGYRDAQVAWMEARASSVAALQERQRAERCSSHSERQQPQPRQQPGAAASGAQGPAVAWEVSGGGGPVGASQAEKAARGERECTSADAHGRGHERGPGPGQGLHRREAHPSPQQHHVLSKQQQQQAARQPHSQRLAVDGVGSGGGGEYVLLLAVYAPRRQTLELWFPLQGERLAVVAAPPKARLLQRGGGGSGGGELGTWRVADPASAASPPMSPTGCMICFAGAAPALEFGAEPEPAGAGCGEGLELLDVGSVFGLA